MTQFYCFRLKVPLQNDTLFQKLAEDLRISISVWLTCQCHLDPPLKQNKYWINGRKDQAKNDNAAINMKVSTHSPF